MKNFYFLFVLVLLLIASCEIKTNEVEQHEYSKLISVTGATQGSSYRILYYDSLGRNVQNGVDSLLARIDSTFSTYRSNSIISRFNNCEKCAFVDKLFLEVFFLSDEIYEATSGAFDPSVKPILGVWGFGSHPINVEQYLNGIKNRGNQDYLLYNYRDSLAESMLDLVAWEKIKVDGDLFYNSVEELGHEDYQDNYVCKEHPKMELSFDAIAQGFSVDLVADYLKSLGIANFLVEIGDGEIIAEGLKPSGKNWSVSVEHPYVADSLVDENFAIVKMGQDKFRALAVSGNYRNNLESFNNQRYGHTIDPRTGIPAENKMLSTAVFTNDCAKADAYATAFMVMGPKKAITFMELNIYDEMEVLFIYLDANDKIQTYASFGLEDELYFPKK